MTLKQLNISYLNDDFKEWFDWEKVKPVKVKMTEKILERVMNDQEILDELKPEPITLAQFFGSLKNLDKKKWYLCYIKDKNNTLRAVNVFRGVDGWYVYAYSVENPDRWVAGRRVFSCDFQTPSDTITGEITFNGSKYKLVKV